MHSESSTHTRNRLAFAPLRGVATRRFRRPIADLGHMKGWLHWRLLGALLKRRRAGCLQPESSGPFVLATAPILLSPCAPAPLCSARAIDPIQSISYRSSSAPCQPTGPPRPVRSTAQRPRRAPKRKTGLEVRACDGAFDFAPPHSAAGPRGPAANA